MTSMTLDPPLTNLLSPAAELVAGVDTHKNTHHVAILDLVGRPVADREFRADGRGYAQVIRFLHEHGDVTRVGVEGTGSYGGSSQLRVWWAARRCLGRGRGLPRMGVLTLPTGKTSTCLTLHSPALT